MTGIPALCLLATPSLHPHSTREIGGPGPLQILSPFHLLPFLSCHRRCGFHVYVDQWTELGEVGCRAGLGMGCIL